MEFLPLETHRLILRPLEEADATPMTILADDERVAKNLARLPSPYTLKDASDFIEKVRTEHQERSDVILAITRKEGNVFMGVVGLEGEDVGYWLGHNFWGKGYGAEAMRSLVDLSFRILKRPKLRASVLADNGASRRILEKLGFIQTNPKACTSLAYEGTRPGFWYQLLCDDFMKIKE